MALKEKRDDLISPVLIKFGVALAFSLGGIVCTFLRIGFSKSKPSLPSPAKSIEADSKNESGASALQQKATEVGARVDALQAAGTKKSGRAYEKADLNEYPGPDAWDENYIAILVAANTGNMELRDLRNEADDDEAFLDKWHKEDKVLDDQWVLQSRKKGREKGVKSQTSHLEGLKWEVIVVDEPDINAFCLPGGKIVVFTALLEHFLTDPEVATIIGHEVGHAVARHSAEQTSKDLWLTILQLIHNHFFSPDIVNTMSNLFLSSHFIGVMEMEADYIGLLLLAAAGFDRRVAPQVYEKLGEVSGQSALQDYLATHPSGEKRAQVLSQAKVMWKRHFPFIEKHSLDKVLRVFYN
ncbi:hypothetical protein CASFOL_022659 [Castilleja foliolosa]|uniref:Peptidase M48 domain-containing protein n=1 Tax=Castilleja foliolosa TaxID=1961234 RepID=A0ABD3CW44_9LAMI